MQYRIIEHGTDAYKQSLKLRDELLRAPLGMNLFDGSYDDLSQEHRYYHFGAFDDHGQLVASIMGIPISPTEIRIKQMVVSEDIQHKGVGKRLFMAFEAHLLNLGFENFILHARRVAAGFYLNLGYEIIGDEFQEVGIPHYKMSKVFYPVSK